MTLRYFKRKKKTETETENENCLFLALINGDMQPSFDCADNIHVLINIDSLRKNALNQAGNEFLRAPVSTVHRRTC